MTGARLGSLLLAAGLALLPGCSTEPEIVRPSPAKADVPRTLRAYVVSHGWHTGLIVPASGLNAQIPELATRFGTTIAFYEIGWGDKGFYQAQDITTGLALRALFWSPGTVMHVSAVPASPSESFPESEVIPICVSQGESDALYQFLSRSFSHDESGRLVPRSKGIYGDSQFYDASGRYSAANTCNRWTAKGLASAGFDVDPSFKLTAGSVMYYLRRSRTSHACEGEPGPPRG